MCFSLPVILLFGLIFLFVGMLVPITRISISINHRWARKQCFTKGRGSKVDKCGQSLKNWSKSFCMASYACEHHNLSWESARPGVQILHGHALKLESSYRSARPACVFVRPAVCFCTTMPFDQKFRIAGHVSKHGQALCDFQCYLAFLGK